MSHLFTQDDHLSDLSLERVFSGEVAMEEVLNHLDACENCSRRLDAIRQHEADYERPIFQTSPPARSIPPVYGTLMAAAAAALIFVAVQNQDNQPEQVNQPQWSEPAEYFRVKGGLNVEFFVNRGGQVQRAVDKSVVHPGDRLGFQVSTPVAGHLMIVGQDSSGEPYLCFPQDANGQSHVFGPTENMVTLDQAMVLDDVLGEESLTAIFCESSFDFGTVSNELKADDSPDAGESVLRSKNCRERIIKLLKKPTETQ